MIQIGKVSLNPSAFAEYTKERFFDEYRGKLDIDKEVVWEMICKENGYQVTIDEIIPPNEVKEIIDQAFNEAKKKIENESAGSTGKQSKRTKRK